MTLNLCSAVRDMVVLSSPPVSAEATLTSSGVSSFSTFLCFSFPLFFRRFYLGRVCLYTLTLDIKLRRGSKVGVLKSH